MYNKKLAYSILKELEKNKWGTVDIQNNYSDVDEETLNDTLVRMKNRELIVGVIALNLNVYYTKLPLISVTEKGEKFLEENNGWKKFYKGLKEIRDWIK
ncbi:hypothetical protein EZL62_01630 [Listeria monocytogenes]|nr:hypothetical protein [Listeria monocytogenes]